MDPQDISPQVELLNPEEIRRPAAGWNQTERRILQSTIPRAFEFRVKIGPSAVAAEFEGNQLTYRELNERANRLGRRLRDAGARPGTLVALCVDRSLDMLVSVLAVLKAGAAYLPVDPGLPKERIEVLLTDAAPSILLARQALLEMLPDTGLEVVDCQEGAGSAANLETPASPEDLAYVLYTSGSTGRPKGVEISHRSVINLLESLRREPGFTDADSILAVAALSFDMSVLDMFLPLVTGGKVVIAPREDALDSGRLRCLIERTSPNVVQATPTMWRALLEAGWTGDRRLKILCGGEAMAPDLAERLLACCGQLWNMYGPTETTVYSSIQRVTSPAAISIGRPIANTQMYVLDQSQRLVPEGTVGELYIGGAGLARGYRGREDLTRERFMEAPEIASGRLYRTGDLARCAEDGTIQFLGRADRQVKIRGFRIELEEIEAALLAHPEIRAAAVRTWPDVSGDPALTAYIVSSSQQDVRTFLKQRLPHYMVPARVILLDALPLTPSGKVDRKRLPPPSAEEVRADFIAPSGDMERRLAAIWNSVLNQDRIGIRDDFFDLGGHSLLAATLLRRIEAEFGQKLSLAAIFQAPTVEQLAKVLRDGEPATARPRVAPIQSAGARPPLFWINAGPKFRALAARLGNQQPFLGVALEPDDLAQLPEKPTLEQLAQRLVRNIRTAQPSGPYFLGGWCASGVVAYEAACQLEAAGQEVAQLILLDALNPVYERGLRRGDVLKSRVRFHWRKLSGLRAAAALRYLLGHARESLQRRLSEAYREQEADAKMYRAVAQYQPGLYAGQIALLEPEERLDIAGLKESWGSLLPSGSELYCVPGAHDTVLAEPYVGGLAARLGECLEHSGPSRSRDGDSGRDRGRGNRPTLL